MSLRHENVCGFLFAFFLEACKLSVIEIVRVVYVTINFFFLIKTTYFLTSLFGTQ